MILCICLKIPCEVTKIFANFAYVSVILSKLSFSDPIVILSEAKNLF